MTIEPLERVTKRQKEDAKPIETLVLPDWVAQHVAGGGSGYEFSTQFIQWCAIIVRNCDDVALRPTHARYFFVQNDRFAIAD